MRVFLTSVIVYCDLLTGEKIDAKAVNEAEDGYDVAQLKKRGRGRSGRGAQPSQVVAVRFTPEEIAELDRRAQLRQMSRSELIREAALL
ncbi:CopG family transcriptional regulator [Trueperella sp.]|uniref:CopG family transcriptional regulator n=1 Tax=Trueperella sp. TaxID=2699835 RepID=UPI00344CB548